MKDSTKKLLMQIQTEISVVWSLLIYYEQWFGSEHIDERKLLFSEVPGFFALQQRILLDSALLSLSRLLENSESGRNGANKNLSIDRLIEIDESNSIPELIKNSFSTLKNSWRSSEYQELKNHRDHHVAHNDWTTRQHNNSSEFYLPSVDFFQKLKGLFCRLFKIFRKLYFHFLGSDFLEPQFTKISMHPQQVTHLISAGKRYFSGLPEQQNIHFKPVHTLCDKEI